MMIEVAKTIKEGHNVLWMRMFDEEFKGEFIQNFINILNKIDPSLQLDGCEGGIELDGIQRIYLRSLNVFGKARGNGSSTGRTTLSVLDEFIPEDGRTPKKGVYIPMMALVRTFSNYDNNCVCYCLGNCITPLSDLFASLQAFPKRGQDITKYPDKGVIIEVCRGYTGAIPDKGCWSKVVKAGAMRTYEEFEGMFIDDFICKIGKVTSTQMSIKFNEREYLNLYNDRKYQIWVISKKPNIGVKPMSVDGDPNCIFMDDHIKKEVRRMFFTGRYRFNSYNCLSRFLTIMNLDLS